MKRAFVDKSLCIGCGLCTEICPQVFEMGDDDKSHVRAREGISGGFWRGEDKAAKEGEADILLILRCSLTPAAAAAARPKPPGIDSWALKTDPVPPEAEESCHQAADQCPVSAIRIEES